VSPVAQNRAAPAQLTISDPQVMRALAHPARLAILQFLTTDRTATATECAEVVGLSPSAISYHLRALAKAGLVEEAPSRGDGRERVWRGVVGGFSVDSARDASDEVTAAQREVIKAFMASNDAEVVRWLDRAREEPIEWYDATIFRRAHLLLTAAELKELLASIDELMQPYVRSTRPEPPAGARSVSMVYRALPMNSPERDLPGQM
jgi:DNA-binding transcriptional ArsR family regulator